MTNKLTLTEQEELFAKDCKLINLKYEYNGNKKSTVESGQQRILLFFTYPASYGAW